MQWNGDSILRAIDAELTRRLNMAAIHLVNETRQLLSVPGRTVSYSEITRGKNKGQTRANWGPYGSNPSRPGEPPHKQLGTLRSSIAFEVQADRKRALVGTTLVYGKYLELGTAGGKVITAKNGKVLANRRTGQVFGKKVIQGAIRPRPFLRRALAENREAIRQIIAHGERSSITVGA